MIVKRLPETPLAAAPLEAAVLVELSLPQPAATIADAASSVPSASFALLRRQSEDAPVVMLILYSLLSGVDVVWELRERPGVTMC
jgi:hypothetical protein